MLDEEDIDRSPMERVKQPQVRKKLIPVIRDDDTKRVLDTCKGKDFVHLRDEAIIRLYYNTGARLSEVGNLTLDDLDMDTDSAHYRGKGNKDRRVRFGPKTARALSRYLRARAKRKAADYRICGWPNGASAASRRTASKSCSSAAAWPRVSPASTPIAGGTTSPTSGNAPAATPAT